MTIAIRREDLSKKGEKRVAIVPAHLPLFTQAGHRVLVQPAQHPEKGEVKRSFADTTYLGLGAEIREDLSDAEVIFGLKEVETSQLLPDKAYFFFSHTHKGQVKNRPLLQALVEKRATLIDYELITDAEKRRLITAFTFFAGYAGMTDSLWTYGQRLQGRAIAHPLAGIPQSIELEDLGKVKERVRAAGERIRREGTPADLPPLITAFMGTGKTSYGAQEIYDLLPVKEVRVEDLPRVFAEGSRQQVYKVVCEIPDMYRLKDPAHGTGLDDQALMALYLREPDRFESRLEEIFPYVSLLMNCIIWAPRFPRLLTREATRGWYAQHQTLEVIGDITCDPDGAIQFSEETWIDDPVFVYDPATDKSHLGLDGEGIAVMAVTNLPCEFSADASAQFSEDFRPLMPSLAQADFSASDPAAAGLPEPLQRATILWKGEFTPDFAYMREFLPGK